MDDDFNYSITLVNQQTSKPANWVETGESRAYLSLEELDAICAIAHELLEKGDNSE